MIAAHELLHLLIFPGAGFNANTVIGIWPKLAAPYGQYRSPMGRDRFILATLLPVLILSILSIFLAAMHIGPVSYLSWISVGNLIGAGSDIFIVGKLLSAVTAYASVGESVGKLYWA